MSESKWTARTGNGLDPELAATRLRIVSQSLGQKCDQTSTPFSDKLRKLAGDNGTYDEALKSVTHTSDANWDEILHMTAATLAAKVQTAITEIKDRNAVKDR